MPRPRGKGKKARKPARGRGPARPPSAKEVQALIAKRIREEETFNTIGTRKGREWFHKAHEHYATAHKPVSVEEAKAAQARGEKKRAQLKETRRQIAQQIAEMDREAKEGIKELERARLSRRQQIIQLSKVRAALQKEEMRLEDLERRVDRTAKRIGRKKRLEWIRGREEEVGKQLSEVSEVLKELKKSQVKPDRKKRRKKRRRKTA